MAISSLISQYLYNNNILPSSNSNTLKTKSSLVLSLPCQTTSPEKKCALGDIFSLFQQTWIKADERLYVSWLNRDSRFKETARLHYNVVLEQTHVDNRCIISAWTIPLSVWNMRGPSRLLPLRLKVKLSNFLEVSSQDVRFTCRVLINCFKRGSEGHDSVSINTPL